RRSRPMVMTADQPGLPGIREIWAAFHKLCEGLGAAESTKLERRLGRLWGSRILAALARLFHREFGQQLSQARLSSVVEAIGDACERAELGRCAFDFEDADDGLVHVWQYDCPLAADESLAGFAASFLEGFYSAILPPLADRPVEVRWLATEPRRRVLRFLAGSSRRAETWDWQLGNAELAVEGAP
ncbi:MAG: hypothetical protein AAGF23_25075, partial [Acidobacteriota bacterium]